VRWQAYEAGDEICPDSRICPPGRDFESTNCVSWYKLKYVEEVSCHGKSNYLKSGKPNILILNVLLLTARQYSKLPINWNGFLHSPARRMKIFISRNKCYEDTLCKNAEVFMS
jgi:hypothetical protein